VAFQEVIRDGELAVEPKHPVQNSSDVVPRKALRWCHQNSRDDVLEKRVGDAKVDDAPETEVDVGTVGKTKAQAKRSCRSVNADRRQLGVVKGRGD
jgi:hypothetical protein